MSLLDVPKTRHCMKKLLGTGSVPPLLPSVGSANGLQSQADQPAPNLLSITGSWYHMQLHLKHPGAYSKACGDFEFRGAFKNFLFKFLGGGNKLPHSSAVEQFSSLPFPCVTAHCIQNSMSANHPPIQQSEVECPPVLFTVGSPKQGSS